MTADEALLTIAEIAIATIGFAGIVSALRPKSSHVSDSMHRLRLRLAREGLELAYRMPSEPADPGSLPGGWTTPPRQSLTRDR